MYFFSIVKPDVTVMEQEVFAEKTDSVNMSCAVQASPLSEAYWVQGANPDGNGTPLKNNWKYRVSPGHKIIKLNQDTSLKFKASGWLKWIVISTNQMLKV
jgi:hypothetical protein